MIGKRPGLIIFLGSGMPDGEHHETVPGWGIRKIGESVLRKEDDRYIQGQGRYADDVNVPGQLHAAFARSDHAHGILKSVDTSAAASMPGVVAVLTGEDYVADGHGPVVNRAVEADPADWKTRMFSEGGYGLDLKQWPLVTDRVRHVGEPYAIVIAETADAAADAAGLVNAELDLLSPVVDVFQAGAEDAPVINDGAPGNIVVECKRGPREETRAAMQAADVVVEGEFFVPRTVCCQMEPRAGVAEYDAESGRYTLTHGTQGVHRHRDMVASALGVESGMVRVICPDVGGGFGSRSHAGPEYSVLAWAAKRLGRPVKWTGGRTEAFISDWQGRDMVLNGRLGVSHEGKIEAYELTVRCNNGAHTVCYAPPGNLSRLVTTVYDIPNAYLDLTVYLTNTVPVLPYRAAGRPETTFAIERLIDAAAAEIGVDGIEIRLKNMIASADMPKTTAMGMTYDVGDFPKALEMVADMVDWPGFEARRRAAAETGKLRGISATPFVETPVGAPFDMARLEFDADGNTVLFAGTQVHGQGHETTYAQVVSDLLGVPFERIRLARGDTDQLPIGGGTHSDRSMRMIGTILYRICEEVVAELKPVAGELLQSDAGELAFADGVFRIEATGQEASFADAMARYIEKKGGGTAAFDDKQEGRIPAFPFGAAAAEVEIDPDTGAMEIINYAIVDDCGRAVNPMIVHGQTAGGIVQGVGQAIGEWAQFDNGSGQLLAGSFMDYVMPRADEYPMFDIAPMEVPTKGNPLGIKAGGEAGTVPALAVIGNAVMDALAPEGVEYFDMPYTAARIWDALNAAKAA